MIITIVFVLGLVVAGIVFWLAAGESKSRSGVGLMEKQAQEKEGNRKKILDLLKKETRLTNNQVQELLGVSDATATRYLDELEKEGRVRQVGSEGRSVYYEKT